jgi:hypothetical protein
VEFDRDKRLNLARLVIQSIRFVFPLPHCFQNSVSQHGRAFLNDGILYASVFRNRQSYQNVSIHVGAAGDLGIHRRHLVNKDFRLDYGRPSQPFSSDLLAGVASGGSSATVAAITFSFRGLMAGTASGRCATAAVNFADGGLASDS